MTLLCLVDICVCGWEQGAHLFCVYRFQINWENTSSYTLCICK